MPDFSAMLSRHATTPSPEEVKATIDRYAAAVSAMDLDGIVAQFAPDARMEDPVDSVLLNGTGDIRNFFAAAFGAMTKIDFYTDGSIRIAGDKAAVGMRTDFDTPEGEAIRVESLDVFHFNTQGKITSLEAYYGKTNVTVLADKGRRVQPEIPA